MCSWNESTALRNLLRPTFVILQAFVFIIMSVKDFYHFDLQSTDFGGKVRGQIHYSTL